MTRIKFVFLGGKTILCHKQLGDYFVQVFIFLNNWISHAFLFSVCQMLWHLGSCWLGSALPRACSLTDMAISSDGRMVFKCTPANPEPTPLPPPPLGQFPDTCTSHPGQPGTVPVLQTPLNYLNKPILGLFTLPHPFLPAGTMLKSPAHIFPHCLCLPTDTGAAAGRPR